MEAGAHEIGNTLAQARSVLMKIPGVLSVGYGFKRRAHSVTQERSWVIFVREKKPITSVSPSELIPSQLFGVSTDVLTAQRMKRFGCLSLDKFDILVGGCVISNLKRYTSSGSPVGDELGTLGFFGTLNNSGSRDNVVLIGSNHVIATNGAAVNDTLYQPRFTGTPPVLSLAKADVHPVATIDNLGQQGPYPYQYDDDPPLAAGASKTQYWLDCATAHINTSFSSWCRTNFGIKYANVIHNLSSAIPGGSNAVQGIARVNTATILNLPAGQDYKVFKVGYETGWTVGKLGIATMDVPNVDDASHPYNNVMVINDLGPNCDGGTTPFAGHGDSGAVILNSDGNVIGHLIGVIAVTPPIYIAAHIHPTVDFLGITLVSSQNEAGASGGATSREIALAIDDGTGNVERAIALREEIASSGLVQRYRTLIAKHLQEVSYLVNRVRPVTVSWHRLQGPDFLAHVLHASSHANYAVPGELNGIGRGDALARILETLSQHGSAALREDIAQYAEEVRALTDQVNDIEALAQRLRAAEGEIEKAN